MYRVYPLIFKIFILKTVNTLKINESFFKTLVISKIFNPEGLSIFNLIDTRIFKTSRFRKPLPAYPFSYSLVNEHLESKLVSVKHGGLGLVSNFYIATQKKEKTPLLFSTLKCDPYTHELFPRQH